MSFTIHCIIHHCIVVILHPHHHSIIIEHIQAVSLILHLLQRTTALPQSKTTNDCAVFIRSIGLLLADNSVIIIMGLHV